MRRLSKKQHDDVISIASYFISNKCSTVDFTLKEIISQFDYYLVNLSSETYVFEDKMTKY